jgi:hypothetical protein
MKMRFRQFLAHAVLAFCGGIGWISGQEAEGDVRAQEYMAEQSVAPIEIKPRTRFQRDFDDQWLKWAERTIVQPFAQRAARWRGQEKDAVDFVRQALRSKRTRMHPDPAVTPATLQQRGRALLAAKVDDPLVVMLHSWSLGKSGVALASLQQTTQDPAFKKLSPCERLLTIAYLWELERELGIRRHKFGKERLEDARAAIEDPAIFAPEDDEVLAETMEFMFEPAMFTPHFATALQICDLPGLSAWTSNYLHGRYEEELAWKFRGNNFAAQVTPDGWKGFREHLPKSREFLVKAWQLHPERPSAPSAMIRITNSGGGGPGETVRLWFDRTTAAQFDRMDAYDAFVTANLPRWGGSLGRMKAFGLACVETGRHDTLVPPFVLFVMQLLVREQTEWRPVFRDELLANALLTANEGQIGNPARAWERERLRADQAVCAWACGDLKRAGETLKDTPSPFPTETIAFARKDFDTTESTIRGDCVFHTSGRQSDWEAAESAYREKRLMEAGRAYVALGTAMGKDTPPLVAQRVAAVKAELALASGDWVRMNVTPALEHWTVHSGHWEGTREGVLVNQGEGKPGIIVYNARVGENFEVRGEYEMPPQGEQQQGVGIILGFAGIPAQHWLLCVQNSSKSGSDATLLHQFDKRVGPSISLGRPPRRIAFFIRSTNGRISYMVNNKEIFKDHVPQESAPSTSPRAILPDSSIGFAYGAFPMGSLTRILKAEVRRLK